MTNIDLSGIDQIRSEIAVRLQQFHDVPRSLWLRELMLCLLTPQSSPVRAEECMKSLESEGLFEGKLQQIGIAEILRIPKQYVRFHNVKSRRILKFLDQSEAILTYLSQGYEPVTEREYLVQKVDGYALKEASHGLRNIGRRDLAILDRHILRILNALQVIESVPKSLSPKRYKEIERKFQHFAEKVGEDLDTLDLFFWSTQTGFVYK